MLETITKVAIYATTVAVLDTLGNKVVDRITGNTDFVETAVPRTCVFLGSVVAGAVTAIAVTDVLFNNPEAVVETVSELI